MYYKQCYQRQKLDNININDGLVNGAIGILKKIDYKIVQVEKNPRENS